MDDEEELEVIKMLYDIYCGILFNNKDFIDGQDVKMTFDFDCPQFEELRTKYGIEKIAGTGSDFERALRLTRWLDKGLKHDGLYDNHIECNSLALMEFCFDKPEVGINCLNKAKVLEECCLALGIYARRVCLTPYSPYDMDNHVVTEIYDRQLNKWVMLDVTTGGYFTDGKSVLNCIEIRSAFAEYEPVSVVLENQDNTNLADLISKNAEQNYYYAKNMFMISMDTHSSFGEKNGTAFLIPKGHSVVKFYQKNYAYRIAEAKKSGMSEELISIFKNNAKNSWKKEPMPSSVSSCYAPIK